MNILGISCYYHDAAAALINDGKLIAAAEEERFSRKKHDSSFPKHAIEFCCVKAGLKPPQLDWVVFYEKSFLKFDRIFRTSIQNIPHSLDFFRESMKEWLFDKIWIKSKIATELDLSPSRLLFCEHHLSHAASAFLCSPFDKAALLTIDGVGEWTTTAWGVGTDNKMELKEEIQFPQSLGLLYSAFTVFCGFEANEGEYKVMGLAPYGKPRFVEKIQRLVDILPDGSFNIDQDYFKYQYSLKQIFNTKFESLFGSPKIPSDEVVPYYADIAASIQVVLEDIILKIVNYVNKRTGLDQLCYGGGVALNSSANWKIATKSPFKDIFIQPAAGDSGGALGAALWAYHSILGKKRAFTFNNAYLGYSETEDNTRKFLKKENVRFHVVGNREELIEKVVDKLIHGKVIGWVQGAFEWGPRALGHRSILADPRSKSMKDLVNSKIKFREGFRPFAPSAISETATKFFSLNHKINQQPLSYMLYVVPVVNNQRDNLGAITHEDGTARPQLVDTKTEPLYHLLINSFGQATGIPVILNTSFNLKGEPIVATNKDAYSTFKRSGIDTLVLGNYIINK